MQICVSQSIVQWLHTVSYELLAFIRTSAADEIVSIQSIHYFLTTMRCLAQGNSYQVRFETNIFTGNSQILRNQDNDRLFWESLFFPSNNDLTRSQ